MESGLYPIDAEGIPLGKAIGTHDHRFPWALSAETDDSQKITPPGNFGMSYGEQRGSLMDGWMDR